MPSVTKLSKFLKADSVRDGDIITFVDAGQIVNKEFKKQTGASEFKDMLEITVDYKGDHKTYSPNATSIGLLSKPWGDSTEKWVGHKAILYVVPTPQGKLMIIAKPDPEEMWKPQ